MKPVAIYARVSSERQKEQQTIASQTAALLEHAASQGWSVPNEWRFVDEGYSGANLVRPGLDSLRDRLAEGQIDTVLVLSPDRLSRKYAYQILLTEEFHRRGAEIAFMKSPPATTPEERLLAQVQGMIAEYERAQLIERNPPWQTASRPAGFGKRVVGCAVRVSLREEERWRERLLRSGRGRGGSCSYGL